MNEFPWEAVVTGLAGLGVALVPFLLAMPLDARIKATISHLERVNETSTAGKNLTSTLNLLTARKYALSEHGAFRWLYLAVVFLGVLLLMHLQGAAPLTAFQIIEYFVALAIALGMMCYSYWQYLQLVKKRAGEGA
ncbi:hypothetical protein SAMN06295974_1357 [Plantibacter flavus]|uniref:Uncharacterized protein n=1 Tax=Plantibacter flavus TaxID=150123 RepID=A0A3N2C703_9MICO|nr:hypothetical protein [Plantibacter flavus]ROR83289.1 hypothetical protein EDD42_3400 [Plantibacter flavus]SMG22324.1 hypothetical protein SAMN06295974_1357 [Plantibacter flavus]